MSHRDLGHWPDGGRACSSVSVQRRVRRRSQSRQPVSSAASAATSRRTGTHGGTSVTPDCRPLDNTSPRRPSCLPARASRGSTRPANWG